MSDGPYKSLPMSRSWMRLAECAENENFDEEDTRAAVNHALATTWRNDVPDEVVQGVSGVFLEREPELFIEARIARIEAVVDAAAGSGLGRLFVAYASMVLAEGLTGPAALEETAKRALMASAASHARQIEEHYCRKASSRLTSQVSNRIRHSISTADMCSLARRCCGLERRSRKSSARPKHTGIEDGVALA